MDSHPLPRYPLPIVDETSQPQPGGRRRAIPLAVTSLFVATSIGGIGLIVQLYLRSLDVPLFIISAVTTVHGIGMLVGSWMWGTISDLVRRRPLLAFLTLALASSLGVLATLPSAPVVLGSLFVRSMLFAGVGAVAIAVISASSQLARRGKNLSYVSSARAFGFAAGNMAAGFILERLGFQLAFIVYALLPMIAFGSVWLLPNENPVEHRDKISAWKAIFSSGLLDLYVSTALRQMAIFGAFSLLYVYMEEVGIRAGIMGVISASNTATQVLALMAFGWLADRIGRQRVFMFGFFLSIITPLCFVFAANVAGMVVGYMTLGIGFSSLYVGSTAYIGDRVPHHRHGQMLGLYESSRGVGGLIGPLIAGAITPLIGFKGMFVVMAAIAGIGFGIMLVGQLRARRASAVTCG